MSAKRLPIPGQDEGNWGEILNDFLLVALNNDGTLKAESVILGKADDSTVVHKSSAETINGSKTFLVNPIVPSPTSSLQAANKSYVDLGLQLKADSSSLAPVATTGSYNDLADKPSIVDDTTTVKLATDQTITGAKDFTGGLQISGQSVVATNDARLSNDRTPSDNSITTVKIIDGVITSAKLSTTVQTSLGKADSALQTAPVVSVAGKSGTVTLVKADVGLGNIDNTSDSAKPISTATQTSLDAKANTADLATVATTGSYSNLLDKPSIPDDATTVKLTTDQTITGAKDFTGGLQISGQSVVATNDARLSNDRTPSDNSITTVKIIDGVITSAKLSTTVQTSLGKADSALQTAPVVSVAGKSGTVTLVKADVGLGNIDNTSDSAKPISTATQTSLDAKANTADLATVATTGSYSNLLNKPTLAPVAASGAYSDLTGIPSNVAIVRSINSISADTTAGAAAHTDYVYIATAALLLTLPTAVGNTNSYTVKNSSSATITVGTSSTQTIDGSSTISVVADRAYVLYSDNTNWIVT